jgi:hypothetical protein
MTETDHPGSTRRRYLATLVALGSGALAGCLSDETDDTDTVDFDDTSVNQNRSDISHNVTNDNGDGDAPEEEPGRSWNEYDCTGEPHYTDDPDWRMMGHDTGNSFVNPHAEGPSDDPDIQWVFERSTSLSPGTLDQHPLIIDGDVYIHKNYSQFVRIDGETGESETFIEFDRNAGIHPVIQDGIVYSGTETGIQANKLESGEQLWHTELPDAPVVVSAIRIVNDTVIATDHKVTYSGDPDTNQEPTKVPEQFAYDAATGELLWSSPGDNTEFTQPRLPLIADGAVQHPGTNSLRDLQSGERIDVDPPPIAYQTLYDGTVYGSPRDGPDNFITYSWKTLDKCWTAAEPRAAGWPVVMDDIVVTHEEWDIFGGRDRETGDLRWESEPIKEGVSSLFRVGGSDGIYVVHDGGSATALDPANGSVEWEVNVDHTQFVSGCAIADELLVTVGDGGTLYGIS